MPTGILFTVSAHGAVNPLLATIRELVARGERIVCFGTEEFRGKFERTGAEFRVFRGALKNLEVNDGDIVGLMEQIIESTLEVLESDLDAIRSERADYLLHDSMCVWGKGIAGLLSLPAVNLMHPFPANETSTPLSFEIMLTIPRLLALVLRGRFDSRSTMRRLRDHHRISIGLRDLAINREGLNIVYISRAMAPDICDREPSYHFVGPSLFRAEDDSDFPMGRLAGKRVVYVSLGTVHCDNVDFYGMCIRALRGSGCMVVLSTGTAIRPGELGELPDDFIVRPHVPQLPLLERVDAFVTHGGMNSVNEALCAGVPMLLLPHQIEQRQIAKQVASMGAGIIGDIDKLTERGLRDSVERLLGDPSYQSNATECGDSFRKDESIAHLSAADLILDHVAQPRP